MALEGRERTAMQNFAQNGPVDRDIIAAFIAMVPEAKRTKIAETLSARVMAGEPMQYSGQVLSLATMATIAVEL